jgi:cytochrome c biogenesis protein CcdA
MNENKLMNQVTAIFGIFMVFFYLGVGVYLIFFFDRTYMDRALLVIIGSSFILYGLYRAFRTYTQIVKLFFRVEKDDDND